MNVVELNPTVSEAVRRTLAQLPEFDPPAARWLEVVAARRARSQPRRRRAWIGFAAGAAAVLALALVLPVRAPWAPDAGMADALAAEVQRSRQLEAELVRARVGGRTSALIAVETDLDRVDGALQAAYDRGAGPEELAPLWRARTAALETLLAAYRHPDTLVRI